MSNQTKTCPPDKILNPASNRCVKRTGKIGKTILSNQSPSRPQRTTVLKTCPTDKILNPTTGRCVKRTGKIGKEILAGQSPLRARASHVNLKSLPKRKSTGRPKNNEEGYDVINVSHMTVKEYIDECKDEKQVPIIIVVENKILFFTSSDLIKILNRDISSTGTWNKCYKIAQNKSFSYVQQKHRSYILHRNIKYYLIKEILMELSVQGLVRKTEVDKLSKVKKLTYVKLKRGEKLVSYISDLKTFRYKDHACDALPYPHYHSDIEYLK